MNVETNTNEKIDPYKHKENYLAWRERISDTMPDVSKENSDIILRYVDDMEKGLNVAQVSVKGGRSYIRLNTLRSKMIFFAKSFERLLNIKITEISEDQLISFFSDMKRGIIKKNHGGKFLSVETYAKCFKAFWHWHQKVNRKKGIEIKDITLDLDTKQEKPEWVYLTDEQVKELIDKAKYNYKVLISFLFDSGIRSPTELINIRVSDFFNDFKEVNIREEISKTFGRRIKLLICSNQIKEYVKKCDLKPQDQVFDICPPVVNRYLRRLALKVFGDKPSPAGAKYSELTMYDFRHISCCYWLVRYKSESALKYRFGWKKSDKIHYYSELLGMRDTINEDDMLVDITKTEIEKKLEKSDKEKLILQERINTLEMQMTQIMELTRQLKISIP